LATLIKLGAKAPKNKAVPYAELKAQRKKEKEEEKERQALKRLSNVRNIMGKKPLTKKKGESSSSMGNKKKRKGGDRIQTKIGSFDGGMLKLSAKDIAAIKGKK